MSYLWILLGKGTRWCSLWLLLIFFLIYSFVWLFNNIINSYAGTRLLYNGYYEIHKFSIAYNNNNRFFYIALFQINDQSASQCIITPVIGFRINSALRVHFLHSLGSIPASRHILQARTMPTQLQYNTWVESSNVDKVSCWRTKVPGDSAWDSNPGSQRESRAVTPLYHGTSSSFIYQNNASMWTYTAFIWKFDRHVLNWKKTVCAPCIQFIFHRCHGCVTWLCTLYVQVYQFIIIYTIWINNKLPE